MGIRRLNELKGMQPVVFPSLKDIDKESKARSEFIITKEGLLLKAVPSHCETMIIDALSRGELIDNQTAPHLLRERGGYISVWKKGYAGKANRKQILWLKRLKLADIYNGVIRGENEEGQGDDKRCKVKGEVKCNNPN